MELDNCVIEDSAVETLVVNFDIFVLFVLAVDCASLAEFLAVVILLDWALQLLELVTVLTIALGVIFCSAVETLVVKFDIFVLFASAVDCAVFTLVVNVLVVVSVELTLCVMLSVVSFISAFVSAILVLV